jgi:hypothetical protein
MAHFGITLAGGQGSPHCPCGGPRASAPRPPERGPAPSGRLAGSLLIEEKNDWSAAATYRGLHGRDDHPVELDTADARGLLGIQRPGLRNFSSGMPSLPTSCRSAAWRSCTRASAESPTRSPIFLATGPPRRDARSVPGSAPLARSSTSRLWRSGALAAGLLGVELIPSMQTSRGAGDPWRSSRSSSSGSSWAKR